MSDYLGSFVTFYHCLKTEKAQGNGKLAFISIHFKTIQTLNDFESINLINMSIHSITGSKKRYKDRNTNYYFKDSNICPNS